MKLPVAASLLAFAICTPVAANAQTTDLGDAFLCCNMRTNGSWISDSNYMESGKTIIPFGTPAKFAGFGRYRVNIDIDGKRQSIGNDYSRDLTMDVFARRYLVKDDPRPRVAAAPPKVRSAIQSARVTKGMTREQVLIALGWPISSENPHLDAATWKYWLWSFSPFTLHFDANGRLAKIETDAETLTKVWLE
jgi:hypothetical protein